MTTPKIGQMVSEILPAPLSATAASGASIFFSKKIIDSTIHSATGMNSSPATTALAAIAVAIAASRAKHKKSVAIGGALGIILALVGGDGGEGGAAESLTVDNGSTFILHNDKIFHDGKTEISLDQLKEILSAASGSNIAPHFLVFDGTVNSELFDSVISASQNLTIRESHVSTSEVGIPFKKEDLPELMKVPAFQNLVKNGFITIEE